MARAAQFASLGRSGVIKPTRLLESFPTPANVVSVEMVSDEVTAVCPVTKQPDQYTVSVVYVPGARCAESKSWKLKLQSYRNKGIFCEALASELADHLVASLHPISVRVAVKQKPRGGVSITGVAQR